MLFLYRNIHALFKGFLLQKPYEYYGKEKLNPGNSPQYMTTQIKNRQHT
jgi:hypothetical protein